MPIPEDLEQAGCDFPCQALDKNHQLAQNIMILLYFIHLSILHSAPKVEKFQLFEDFFFLTFFKHKQLRRNLSSTAPIGPGVRGTGSFSLGAVDRRFGGPETFFGRRTFLGVVKIRRFF